MGVEKTGNTEKEEKKIDTKESLNKEKPKQTERPKSFSGEIAKAELQKVVDTFGDDFTDKTTGRKIQFNKETGVITWGNETDNTGTSKIFLNKENIPNNQEGAYYDNIFLKVYPDGKRELTLTQDIVTKGPDGYTEIKKGNTINIPLPSQQEILARKEANENKDSNPDTNLDQELARL